MVIRGLIVTNLPSHLVGSCEASLVASILRRLASWQEGTILTAPVLLACYQCSCFKKSIMYFMNAYLAAILAVSILLIVIVVAVESALH